jgi:peptide-methionine (R)-S-oxide reductase
MEKTYAVQKTDEEWRKVLTPEQYQVLRGHATERPGSCALLVEHRPGVFKCVGCGQSLFVSDRKFESGTGWPSFFSPLEGAVETSTDRSFFMARTEVRRPASVTASTAWRSRSSRKLNSVVSPSYRHRAA